MSSKSWVMVAVLANMIDAEQLLGRWVNGAFDMFF
jgi:hypothetical protein